MIDLGLIWHISLLLGTTALVTFVLLVLRRAWAEYAAQQHAHHQQSARLAVFSLLEMDEEAFARELVKPYAFSKKERGELGNLCLALCQVIKGRERERVIHIMIHHGFRHSALRDLARASPDLRHAASIALQYFDDADSKAALTRALEDSSVEVCLSAAHSLFALQALPHLDSLLELFIERGVLQTSDCRALFRKLALHYPEQLIRIERVYPYHAGVRTLVADAFGHASSYAVLPSLKRLAHDPASRVRIAALDSLTRLEHPAAGQAVMQALQDPDWEVVAAAARTAGEMSLADAVPRLETLLEHDNWLLRFDACQSLYAIGTAGRRALLRNARRTDAAGRMCSLVLAEKGVSALLPAW